MWILSNGLIRFIHLPNIRDFQNARMILLKEKEKYKRAVS